MSPTVTKIPATRALHTGKPLAATTTKRVAGYARVSTDNEDQASSYQAQVDYYTTFITDHPGWELVKVYTDEGITGTSTAKRAGFRTMVADALAGKIDLIVTKSVSRFARNTVDSLTTVRKLKDAGVEVYFQRENIWTLDSKGELLITIMSSLAQEEARSISENVTWGHRKRFADGKVTIPYGSFLGYEKGQDGGLVINPEQAKVVRLIYALCLEGKTPRAIATTLQNLGVPTARGKKRWHAATIRSILTNEKYKGDALLQKTYTRDFLTKERITNQGEVAQYYVTGSHEPIIEPAVWDYAQTLINPPTQRGTIGGKKSRKHALSGTIKCGQCGGWYGSKTWHAGTKYQRTIWRCNNKYENHTHCTTTHLTEAQIHTTFTHLVAQLVTTTQVATQLDQLIADTFNTTQAETHLAQCAARLERAREAFTALAYQNARAALTSKDYEARAARLEADYDQALADYHQAEAALTDLRERAAKYRRYQQTLTQLQGQDATQFTPVLWRTLIDHATINHNGTIVFALNDGQTISMPTPTKN
ncbi:recombinase family protein [Boudabousia tangfeifanii]|uniref:Recombinase family protein n=1 Tax=Boudabousia tangfeifanii TaxID=1912795 RepID=A0A1D9MI73_9ACTO|nr:recombinase family protein [Boudabousia tangfeifanii]AOZ72031.1 recombinase family protein [Boudabousia tangfeifanii]